MISELFRESLFENNSWFTMGVFTIRTIIGFSLALLFVRLGGKRLFLKTSAFDIVVAIMLGSIISRGITGSSPFLPSMFSAGILVVVHRLLSNISFHSRRFGTWVKGSRTILIENGVKNEREMKRSHITDHDIMNAARTQARITSMDDIEHAFLERSGDISIIPQSGDSGNNQNSLN